jgi:hypothetical protein
VLVGEILARASAPLGRDVSGPAVATYVLATRKDGYAAVFSLAELDSAMTPNDLIWWLKRDLKYERLFVEAFGGAADAISLEHIVTTRKRCSSASRSPVSGVTMSSP